MHFTIELSQSVWSELHDAGSRPQHRSEIRPNNEHAIMTANHSSRHFVEWAKARATPILSDNVVDDVSDLEVIRSIVGNSRIVGFGESQHHVGEFNRMRSKLFRFLVSEMNFTTFVFECGVVETKAAHDYVLGLHDDADAAFVPIESGFSLWREFQELIHWMREYNRKAGNTRKIKFYGMDGSRRWMSTRTAVAYVCDYLDQVNPDQAKATRKDLLPLAQAVSLANAGKTPIDAVHNLVRGLADLVGHLEIQQMHYIERSTFEAFDWAHRASLIARQIGTILSATHTNPENAQQYRWAIRDAGMATELKWILEREGPEGRLLVGASNIHLQKVLASGGRPTAGQHLLIGMPAEQPVMIAGTNYYSLKPDDPAVDGSFQAALEEMGYPRFLLNLRAANEDERVAAWLNEERPDRSNTSYLPLRIARAWDAIYFTRRISLATLSLPGPFKRTYVDIAVERLDGLDGVYDIKGIGDSHVVLRIYRDGDRLLTDGTESDGELFPMHPSELFALSDSKFAWREWAHEVEFERDAGGFAHGLNIRAPKAFDQFRGVKRR
jgi:erythromycin esterase